MKKLTITIAVFTVLVMATSAYSVAPANDMFADSIAISGANGTVSGNNIDATIETGEPDNGNDSTVWWKWTAPSSGACEFNTFASDYDTYLAVFKGNSVEALTLVAENDDSSNRQSKVCFEVSSGQAYQVQVSGYGYLHNNEGNIILNWQLGGPLSDWILDDSSTNIHYGVLLADDLSVFSYKHTEIDNDYHRTNNLGCKIRKTESMKIYSDGFTITDKKENKKVENKPLEGIENNTDIEDYNGKQVLTYDWDSKKLIVYGVKKDAFVRVGEQEIKNFYEAWFEGSEIYIYLDTDHGDEGLKVFDKKLKKEKWTEPLGFGYLYVVCKGLTMREIWTGNDVKIICRKKGKKDVSEYDLTAPPDYWPEFHIDKKGGVLYWIRQSNTNSPITYLDRKGKKIIDNQSLTDVGNVWEHESSDGNTLYVSKEISPSNFVFYVYKLKGLKNLGQQNIDMPKSGSFNTTVNKNVYVIPNYFDGKRNYAVHVFDKKLKKEQWNLLPYAEGRIKRIGKDALYRYSSSKDGDTVTEVYKLFNKKGEIVTYTFVYDE